MFIDEANKFLKMNHSSMMFTVHCQAPCAVQVGVTIKSLFNIHESSVLYLLIDNYIPITIEEVNCKVQAFEVVQPNPYKNTSQVRPR